MHCFPDKGQGVPKSYLEGKDGQRNRSYCIHSTLYSRHISTGYDHNCEAQTVAKKAHDGAGDYRPGEPGTRFENMKKRHPRIQGGLGLTIITEDIRLEESPQAGQAPLDHEGERQRAGRSPSKGR